MAEGHPEREWAKTVERAIGLEADNWLRSGDLPTDRDEMVRFFWGVLADLRRAEGYELRKAL